MEWDERRFAQNNRDKPGICLRIESYDKAKNLKSKVNWYDDSRIMSPTEDT